MRLGKYTLDVRECRAKRGARRERTNITKTGKMQSIFPEREALNPTEMLAFRVGSVSDYGVPENACHFWGINAATPQDNSFDFR